MDSVFVLFNLLIITISLLFLFFFSYTALMQISAKELLLRPVFLVKMHCSFTDLQSYFFFFFPTHKPPICLWEAYHQHLLLLAHRRVCLGNVTSGRLLEEPILLLPQEDCWCCHRQAMSGLCVGLFSFPYLVIITEKLICAPI